jgi:hypothetical protein
VGKPESPSADAHKPTRQARYYVQKSKLGLPQVTVAADDRLGLVAASGEKCNLAAEARPNQAHQPAIQQNESLKDVDYRSHNAD